MVRAKNEHTSVKMQLPYSVGSEKLGIYLLGENYGFMGNSGYFLNDLMERKNICKVPREMKLGHHNTNNK